MFQGGSIMDFKERKPMQLIKNKSTTSSIDFKGYIELSHLAKPGTMKTMIADEAIIPESFNTFGEPLFNENDYLRYHYKELEIRKNLRKKDFTLEVDISYEILPFTISKESFDTLDGIKKSLTNLGEFNKLLSARNTWFKKVASKGEYLNAFVVFGKYILDSDGTILLITNGNTSYSFPDVCTLKEFEQKVRSYSATSKGFYIPSEYTCCTCCGKPFTIDDLRKFYFKEI